MCIDPDAVESDGTPDPTVGSSSPPSPPPPAAVDHVEQVIARDPPKEASPAPMEEEDDTNSDDESPTGHAFFDDILLHSQARMLESIVALGRDVDLLVAGGRGKTKGSINMNEDGGEVL